MELPTVTFIGLRAKELRVVNAHLTIKSTWNLKVEGVELGYSSNDTVRVTK